MTLEDLAAHKTEEVTPISIDVDGLRVYECPPNGQVLWAIVHLLWQTAGE
jgi:gamma-glutamyltranspeptidase / glutathione hydrolase